ncbi:MAG: hypothetical protein AAGF01_16010 [Cyanobacteria bacterium P01_G01_bin.38]
MSVTTYFLEGEDTHPVLQDEQTDVEQMHDVLLLLENLALREETTVKLILGCLYDIGAQTLVDQKVHYRPANRLASWVVQSTKPVALVLGLRWFKRNAPKAISDWLYSQVSSSRSLPSEPPVPTVPSEHLLESHFTELQRLRARVRWLSGLSIGMIVMLIGVVSR